MVEFLFKNKNTTSTLLFCNTAYCMEVTLAGYLTADSAAFFFFSFCSLHAVLVEVYNSELYCFLAGLVAAGRGLVT